MVLLYRLFDYLPLVILIEGKIFCVHGGLSPFISVIEQIRLIKRKMEPDDQEADEPDPGDKNPFFSSTHDYDCTIGKYRTKKKYYA